MEHLMDLGGYRSVITAKLLSQVSVGLFLDLRLKRYTNLVRDQQDCN